MNPISPIIPGRQPPTRRANLIPPKVRTVLSLSFIGIIVGALFCKLVGGADHSTDLVIERQNHRQDEVAPDRSKYFGNSNPEPKPTDPDAGKIIGAFGLKLGAHFDPADAIAEHHTTDGETMYEFNPINKFQTFNRYFVLLTPVSHQIYCIWAIGRIENTAACTHAQELILALLREKYGTSGKQDLWEKITDEWWIHQGHHHVHLKCSGLGENEIHLQYFDSDLSTQARLARLELEKRFADPSGL
jgi:hypothetical protein